MRDCFASHGETALAELPASAVEASTAAGRPVLVAGAQPAAVVVLLDVTAQAMTDA